MKNNRLIATLILTGGLALSGAASASAWSWTGTLADWAASGGGTGVVTDGDGDMQFTLFPTTDIPDRPGVGDYITLSEIEVGGKDFYDVGVNWGPNGYAGGGQLVYTLSTVGLTDELIRGATLDSTITGDGTASLMRLYDLPANTLIDNLSSFNGARDPVSGEVSFDGRSIVGAQQVFLPSNTGVYQDSHAGFVVSAVPEPTALSLAGIGLLLAIAAGRRKA